MSFQINRLLDEVKTLAGLLKLKVRVEGGCKEDYFTLMQHIEKIIQLEERINSQSKHYEDLENEVVSLRKTCEKFTELSGSIELLNGKYKLMLSQANSEKAKLQEENIDIRSNFPYFL